MYEFIDGILTIKGKDSSYFFDPDTMLIFSKNDMHVKDEGMIKDYLKKKKSFPKERKNEHSQHSTPFSRINLELHVTNKCNLRCRYCYVGEECDKERSKQMSEEVIEKSFIFTLKNFPKTEVFSISLWGGEPLLFWEKFPFIVEKSKEIFKNKEVHFGFSTNGTIMNEEILEFLKKHNFSIQISLDGPENSQNFLRPTVQAKGSYKIIEKTLSLWNKKGLKSLSSRATITPYNMDLTELFLFFQKKGFHRINFNLCSSLQNDLALKEEHLPILFQNLEILAQHYLLDLIEQKNEKPFHFAFFEKYLKSLHVGNKKNTFCGVGRNLFIITPEGNIYSCHRFVGNEQYKIGDINKGFFKDKDIRKTKLHSNVDQNLNCKNCFGRYLCGGGCVHEKHIGFDKISCAFRRHVFYLAIWIYAELQTKHRSVLSRWDTKKRI